MTPGYLKHWKSITAAPFCSIYKFLAVQLLLTKEKRLLKKIRTHIPAVHNPPPNNLIQIRY